MADGTITNEEGDSMKETLENNMDTCTGIPGQGRDSMGTGQDARKGHMSGGGFIGTGNCYIDNTVK